eukprot:INCI7058.1.p1 GENE.INCI7058.1~~INCI7058.1.p1  ORF type:complete len:710 (-),score=185.17 INCI7058.1:78-2207(-)
MSESETESPLGSPSAATSAATAAAAAEVPMQSPLMAALLQVGAATQATIDSATDQIRERLSGSNDALQKIIDNNFEEFEARTSRIQEDHEALKAHADSRFSEVKTALAKANEVTNSGFEEHRSKIGSIEEKLQALQNQLQEEKTERIKAEERLDERVNEASAASKVARDELHTSLVGHIQTLRTDMNARHDEGASNVEKLEEAIRSSLQQNVETLDAKLSDVTNSMQNGHARLEESIKAAREETTSLIAEENEVWSGHVRSIKAAQSQASRDNQEARLALQTAFNDSLAAQKTAVEEAIQKEIDERGSATSKLETLLNSTSAEHAKHLQEFQDAVATAQVASRNEHKALSEQLQQLEASTASQFADASAAQENLKAEQAKAAEQVEARYTDMRNRHDNSNANFTDLIVQIKEGMDSIVERMETSTSDNQAYVENVEASIKTEQLELEKRMAAEIAKINEAAESARDKTEADWEALSADIDTACEEYQTLIADVRRQLEIKFTETEIKIVGAEQKNSTVTAETAAQLDAHSTQLSFLKNSLKTVESDGAKRRDELKTIVQGLIITNKSEQESRLETVDREMDSLKAQLDMIQETLRTELQLTKASTEQKLDSIMSATQRNIMGLKEDQEAQANAIETAKSKLESRLESLKSVHESTSQHLNNLVGKRNWVNDKEVDNCQCCDRRFSLTVRKHHCRMYVVEYMPPARNTLP